MNAMEGVIGLRVEAEPEPFGWVDSHAEMLVVDYWLSRWTGIGVDLGDT